MSDVCRNNWISVVELQPVASGGTLTLAVRSKILNPVGSSDSECVRRRLSQQFFTKTDNSVKWNAFQNEFSNLFLLFYWIKELILVLQLFSFAFKFVQTIMYCICIVAKPNHVILYIQNQSCPRNWEFCCELLESEWSHVVIIFPVALQLDRSVGNWWAEGWLQRPRVCRGQNCHPRGTSRVASTLCRVKLLIGTSRKSRRRHFQRGEGSRREFIINGPVWRWH